MANTYSIGVLPPSVQLVSIRNTTNQQMLSQISMTVTYGNLFTYFQEYDVDLIDDVTSYIFVNNSNKTYTIEIGSLIIVLSPGLLNPNDLFSNCPTLVKDSLPLGAEEIEDVSSVGSNYIVYFKNDDIEDKKITIIPKNTFFNTNRFMVNNPADMVFTDGSIKTCLAASYCVDVKDPCELATETIKVGILSSGGYYDFFVNGVQVGGSRAYAAFKTFLLEAYGVELIPLSADLEEIEPIDGQYYNAEIGLFKNTTEENVQIKIRPTDASPIRTVYEDTGNEAYDFIGGGIDFCLGPALPSTCEGATKTTGFVDYNGTFDVYINDMLVPAYTNLTEQQLLDLVDNRIDFIEFLTPDLSILCSGIPETGVIQTSGLLDFYVNDVLTYHNVTPEQLVSKLQQNYPDLDVEIIP